MFTIIYNMFGSKDAFTRNAATMIFAGIGDESVNYLEQSFFNSDDEIKKLILDSLFGIGTPNTRKAIRHGLNDNSMNVLISSIEYLGLLSDTESNSRFIEILKSADQPMLKITLLHPYRKFAIRIIINQAVEILLSGIITMK